MGTTTAFDLMEIIEDRTEGINDHCKPVASNKLVRFNNRNNFQMHFRQLVHSAYRIELKGESMKKKR